MRKRIVALMLAVATLGGALVAGCAQDDRAEAGADMREGANQTAHTADNVADDAARGAGDVADATGDAAMTGTVKSALLADTEVGALDINVDTVGETVHLKGTVSTEAQKMRAENIARETAGGNYRIENHLVVQP
jgi:hyperosmotically inducible periplasmic protein